MILNSGKYMWKSKLAWLEMTIYPPLTCPVCHSHLKSYILRNRETMSR